MLVKQLAFGATLGWLLIAAGAAPQAKEPSSVFGSGYDARSSTLGRGAPHEDDDDGGSVESPRPRRETRPRLPSVRKPLRTQLDGGPGREDPDLDDGDDL